MTVCEKCDLDVWHCSCPTGSKFDGMLAALDLDATPGDTRDEAGSDGQSPPAGDNDQGGWMPQIHVVDSIPPGTVYSSSQGVHPVTNEPTVSGAKLVGLASPMVDEYSWGTLPRAPWPTGRIDREH